MPVGSGIGAGVGAEGTEGGGGEYSEMGQYSDLDLNI